MSGYMSDEMVERLDEATALVRALVKAGCESQQGQLGDLHCHYCGAWLEHDAHAADCAYVRAVEFVERDDKAYEPGLTLSLDAQGRLRITGRP